MTEQDTRPSAPFMKLLNIMDDLRRRSFQATPAAQIQSMMGLTIRQSAALRELKALTTEAPQGVALKVLAKSLQMTMPATSLLVEAMVNKGYFVREPNPADRRAICIKLSDEGQALFQDLFAKLQENLELITTQLLPQEISCLQTIADKLHRKLYEEF